MVDGLALDLLGREVRSRAHQHVGLRRARLGQRAREAEVGDLHDAVRRDEDVLRLDVAVHQAVAAGMLERGRDLQRDACGHVGTEHVARGKDLAQVLTVHELHRHVRLSVLVAEVEHLDDVGMHEPRGRERLSAEAGDELRVLRQVLGEHLHGDLPLQPPVAREADGRHAADAEAVAELVAACEDLAHGAVAPPLPEPASVVVV